MKVYVVVTDDYDEPYGAQLNLHGVFSTREKAERYVRKYRDGYMESIQEVEIDKVTDVYLGGYYE